MCLTVFIFSNVDLKNMSANNIKRFICSSELFSSYELDIDVNFHDSIESIIEYFKNDMIELFNKHRLHGLVEQMNNTRFHIHSYTIKIYLIQPLGMLQYKMNILIS